MNRRRPSVKSASDISTEDESNHLDHSDRPPHSNHNHSTSLFTDSRLLTSQLINKQQSNNDFIQGNSTATDLPADISPSSSTSKLIRQSASSAGGPGRSGSGVSGAFTTQGSRVDRSDSVSLSQAEGGSFKSSPPTNDYALPLLNGSDAQSPRFATSFPPVRVSFSSILRSWSSRRSILILLGITIFVTLVLSPTKQGSQVLHKANKAFEDGWDKAETYWDDIRKHKIAEEAKTKQKKPKQPSFQDFNLGAESDETEPHKLKLPPMHAGNAVKEESILKAVRTKPALHANKEKTTRCESNTGVTDRNGKQRPVVQYAIMIDAGSTGSRVHVYKFNFCKSSPELEDEVFEMIQGGLSSYKADSRAAAESLKPLMDTAMKAVPISLRSCTPIAVKATAGLRLLGAEMSHNILLAVRNMLEMEYPFPIADGSQAGHKTGVEIMDGKDEGVFAWITVNYLLNRIGSDGESKDGSKVKTAAVMDLGGASTQIVFEPVYESASQGMHPGEHVYELSNFGGRKYTLYQNSYLGYGLMEARKSINSLSLFTYSLTHPDSVRLAKPPSALTNAAVASLSDVEVPSPCFAEGKRKKTKVRMQGSKDEIEVEMVGTSGGFAACKRLVEVMMDKDAVCKQPPCSFAGVYQPSLMTAFTHLPIMALSYFYDRLHPLGLTETFPLSELNELTKKVCDGPAKWTTHFPEAQYPGAVKELEGRPESCLDFTYLSALLSLGYELSDDRSITVAKKLGGMELGWAAGCTLIMLEEGNICKRS